MILGCRSVTILLHGAVLAHLAAKPLAFSPIFLQLHKVDTELNLGPLSEGVSSLSSF